MANLQAWSCVRCTRNGSVAIETDTGVMIVANAILDDHAAKSPECDGGMDTIRTPKPFEDPLRDYDNGLPN